MKVRKLLITGGCYDTEKYRAIKLMRSQEKTVEEIAELLRKKPITVRSYLPYGRVIYNLEERSVNADRLQRFKSGGVDTRNVQKDDRRDGEMNKITEI